MSSDKDNKFHIVTIGVESPTEVPPSVGDSKLSSQNNPSLPSKNLLGSHSLPKPTKPLPASKTESRRGFGFSPEHPPGVMEDLVLALIMEMDRMEQKVNSESRVLH